MRRILHDVKCRDCNGVERDVFVRVDAASGATTVPPCPTCGGSRDITFSTGSGGTGRPIGTYTPVTIGGVTYPTAESFRAYARKFEQTHGHPLEIRGRSNKTDVAAAEDRANRNLDRVAALGHRGAEWQERTRREIQNAADIATRRGWC